MTSETNAINYTGLDRMQNIETIDGDLYKDVNITENKNSSNIIASFVDDNIRVTTIANSLNANTNSLNQRFKYQRVS